MVMKTLAELSCSFPIEGSWKSSGSSMMLMRMKVVMINKFLAVQKMIITKTIYLVAEVAIMTKIKFLVAEMILTTKRLMELSWSMLLERLNKLSGSSMTPMRIKVVTVNKTSVAAQTTY